MQQESEYNSNHYLLVENYIEKYLPITIQEAITTNVKTFLSRDKSEQHDWYIKSRRKDLHR